MDSLVKPAARGEGFSEPIAIIGIGCRLPGRVDGPDALWQFLKQKGQGIGEIPENRWNSDAVYDPNPDAISKSVSKWAGCLEDIAGFDPSFFDISPREAAAMDPQQRLLLQTVFEAVQHSGIPISRLSAGSTGVFVGISISDYKSIQERRITNQEFYAGTGTALCIAANRISHRFDFSGPSYAVDTACSSSMVAVDQACRNLQDGTCDVAVAAGVNVMAQPTAFVAFSKAGMLSNTGRLSTFDASANGYVRGEGCGVVVLKPLYKAVADGDPVVAVIRGTCVNQDGRTSTMTAPNREAQIAMLQRLCDEVEVEPEDIGYIEAHGTGTPIGDPIEASAIGRALGKLRDNGPLLVGSIKPNIGHLESAAGVSGLIKAALVLHHGEVPPNVNFTDPNPHIPFDALNLQVPTEVMALPRSSNGAHAIVNSFGFGGTNASAVLQAYQPESAAVRKSRSAPSRVVRSSAPAVIPLSAASPGSLQSLASRLANELEQKGGLHQSSLDNLSSALWTRRDHLSERVAFVAHDRDELKTQLDAFTAGPETDGTAQQEQTRFSGRAQTNRKIAFVFSGQGSQWWAMGRQLMRHHSEYRAAIEEFDQLFAPIAGWSVIDALNAEKSKSRIDDTTYTQPAIFALQIGLVAYWRSLGIVPDMTLGHSIGEAAAAYTAGGLSLESAARFLSKRGLIRDQLGAHGAMAAIGRDAESLRQMLPPGGKVELAAYNAPGSVSITGDSQAVREFVEQYELENPGSSVRMLNVDTAWHSYQLEEGEAWFRKTLGEIEWQNPSIPWISTVTGKLETRFDINYGWRNLREPVRFAQGVDFALDLGANVFLEIGPDRTLTGPAVSCAAERGLTIAGINSLQSEQDDRQCVAEAAARLFVSGVELSWLDRSNAPDELIVLGPYPWQQEPIWKDSEESRQLMFEPWVDPFLGQRQHGPVPEWWSEINLTAFSYLRDHRLQGDCIFPAAGYVNMLVAAGRDMFGDVPLEFTDTKITEALFIEPDDEIILHTVFDAARNRLKVFTRRRDGSPDWTLRAEAGVRKFDGPIPKPQARIRARRVTKTVGQAEIYKAAETDMQRFVSYGPAFQGVRCLHASRGSGVAEIIAPEAVFGDVSRYQTHPSILDSCLQIADPRTDLEKIEKERAPDDPVYLPVGAKRIRFFGQFPPSVEARVTHLKSHGTLKSTDFMVTDTDGNILLVMEGLQNKELSNPNEIEPQDETIEPGFVVENFLQTTLEADESAAAAPGRWLIIGADKKFSAPLTRELQSNGAAVEAVDLPDDRREWAGFFMDLFQSCIEEDRWSISGIVYAGALEQSRVTATASTKRIQTLTEDYATALIELGQALDFHRSSEAPPDVWILTRQARKTGSDDNLNLAGLVQHPIVALTRTLATECQEYRIGQIDVDGPALASSGSLCDAFLGGTAETELVTRGEHVFAARLETRDKDALPPRTRTIRANDQASNFLVTMPVPGILDKLELRETETPRCGSGEITVRVSAVGLNFRDIMAATGLLPAEAEIEAAWRNLGLEFAGIVDTVGDGVSDLAPGDRVMGMYRRCLQRRLTLPAQAVTKVPDSVGLEDASTIPSAFATAHYALNHVGRLRRGERVLIHVATGGVGLAAVQIAQRAGAEIFATAGTPKKRRYLRDLGVKNVMNSRDLAFADRIMKITKGKGVDVILNSLPGPYIDKGLELLAPFGRFLEIGKRDVYADSAIGLKALRRNVSFNVLDLAALGIEQPGLMSLLLEELVEQFRSGELSPLPATMFAVDQVADAFKFMAQAKHIGKVVVGFDQEQTCVLSATDKPYELDAGASYLVTGGSRGFGLSVADWLSRKGAGEIILASRSGAVDEEEAAKLAALRKRGTQVTQIAVDVTDPKSVQSAFAHLEKSALPLKGILHGAAVIDDGFLSQLDGDRIARVMRPKIAGAWNLHRALEAGKIKLDFFVSFSSISQLIGAAGQANYVAANAFLDGFSRYRTGRGELTQTIDWGSLGESGFVARSEALANYLGSVGMHPVSNEEALLGLEHFVRTDLTSALYGAVDWKMVGQANTRFGDAPRSTPLFVTGDAGATQIRIEFARASEDQRAQILQTFLADLLERVLQIETDPSHLDRSLPELGLDSLSSFELKNRIEGELGISLTVAKFLQAPTLRDLAELLTNTLQEALDHEATDLAAAERDALGERGNSSSGQKDDVVLSDRQAHLLRTSFAMMTTDRARNELEHSFAVPVSGDRPHSKDLQKTLNKLARRHELIRMRLNGVPGDGEPLAVIGEFPKLQCADGKNVQQLDLEGGELFRAASRKCDKGHLFVELRAHAAIADKASLVTLGAEFQRLHAGEKLERPAGKKKVREELDARRFDPEQTDSAARMSFWSETMHPWPRAVEFTKRGLALAPVGLGENRGPFDWFEMPVSPQIAMPAQASAAEALLLCCFAHTIAHETNSDDLAICRFSISAERQQPGSRVGPFGEAFPVPFRQLSEAPARQLFDRTRRHLLLGHSYCKFDVFSCEAQFAETLLERGAIPRQLGFVCLDGEDTKSLEDFAAPVPMLSDLLLVATQRSGTFTLKLYFDTEVLAADAAETITRKIDARLLQMLEEMPGAELDLPAQSAGKPASAKGASTVKRSGRSMRPASPR